MTFKRVFWQTLVMALLVGGAVWVALDYRSTSRSNTVSGPISVAVWFSPKGGCTTEAVKEIDASRKTIECQAYSFTSKPIAEALLRAKNRGVKIVIILDKSNLTEHGSDLTFFDQNKIETWIDSKHAIAHSKIFIIDTSTLITGSFNFTQQAETSNAENMLVIRNDPQLVVEYEDNFKKHLAHSDKH